MNRLKKSLIERLNVELGESCRLSYDDLIISYVSFDPYAEDLYITTAVGPMPISKLSPLVEAINEAWKRAPHLFLFVKRQIPEKCGRAALNSLKAVLEPLLDLAVRRVLAQGHA